MSGNLIFVSPQGGHQWLDPPLHSSLDPSQPRYVETERFQAAIEKAKPGDIIQLLPGIYNDPVFIAGKGDGVNPITIRGTGQTTLDGRRNPVRPRNTESIDSRDYAFMRVIDCHGLILDQLTIQNVWPTAIYIENSTDIQLSRLNLQGATFGIFARGQKTRRLIVEYCAWQQDPAIWDKVSWDEIHDPPHPRRELDGDFIRGFQIGGDLVVRNNYIAHAFNGVHLYASRDDAPETVNNNIWIYENTFAFIRDNAVESEFVATNWFVFANRVYNCHVWLAFEKCLGGFWYVFGNRGWFDRLPGPPHDCHTGGGIIKARYTDRQPDNPFYFFNNSFYVRGPYIKKGELKNFDHFNNALDFAKAAFHPKGMVIDGRNPFAANGISPRCDGKLIEEEPFTKDWGKKKLNIRFHNDLCNHPHYPTALNKLGWKFDGQHGEPRFKNARKGDFTLSDDSPCANAGRTHQLAMSNKRVWQLPPSLNIGAMKQDKPYSAKDLNCPAEPPSLFAATS